MGVIRVHASEPELSALKLRSLTVSGCQGLTPVLWRSAIQPLTKSNNAL